MKSDGERLFHSYTVAHNVAEDGNIKGKTSSPVLKQITLDQNKRVFEEDGREEELLWGKSVGKLWNNILQKLLEEKVLSKRQTEELYKNVYEGDLHKVGKKLNKWLEDYKDDSTYDSGLTGIAKTTFRPNIFRILSEGVVEETEREYILRGFTEGFEILHEGIRIGRRVKNPPMPEKGEKAVEKTIEEDKGKKVLYLVKEKGELLFKQLYISPTYAIHKKENGEIKKDELG